METECRQSSQGQVRLQPNPVGTDDQAGRDGRSFLTMVGGARRVELVEPESAVAVEGGLAEQG